MGRSGTLAAALAVLVWLLSAPVIAAPGGGGGGSSSAGGEEKGGDSGGRGRTGTENIGGGVHDGSDGARLEGAYVAIAPIIVTVFSKRGVAGRISAALTLQMVDEAQAQVAAASHTKLRNALIQELHRLSEFEVRRGREYSVSQIKRRLTAVTRKMLGDEAVNDVLVQALTRTGG